MSQPLLSIVVTGHGEFGNQHSLSLLQSLSSQRRYVPAPHSRHPDVMCPFAKTEHWTDLKDKVEIVLSWDGPCPAYNIIHLAKTNIPVRVIDNKKQGGCGHHTRGPGIEAAKGSWIYLQNCDNVLVDGWLDFIYPSLEDPDVGGIYWDCVNNLWAWTTLGGTKMKRGHIDLSCAVFRAEYVKQVGFPFTEYDGDADYLMACNIAALKDRKIVRQLNAVLGIHN